MYHFLFIFNKSGFAATKKQRSCYEERRSRTKKALPTKKQLCCYEERRSGSAAA